MKIDKYESDTTKFIRELLQKNPEIKEDQKKARAMWWDKTLDLKELKHQRAAEVDKRIRDPDCRRFKGYEGDE